MSSPSRRPKPRALTTAMIAERVVEPSELATLDLSTDDACERVFSAPQAPGSGTAAGAGGRHLSVSITKLAIVPIERCYSDTVSNLSMTICFRTERRIELN